MRFLIQSYNSTLRYHNCKPLDCQTELVDLNYHPDPVHLDLMIDGGAGDVQPEELIGRTFSCEYIQPFLGIAQTIVLEG